MGPFVVAVHPESDAPSVRRVIALRSLESALALGAAVEGVVVLLRGEGSLPHRRAPPGARLLAVAPTAHCHLDVVWAAPPA